MYRSLFSTTLQYSTCLSLKGRKESQEYSLRIKLHVRFNEVLTLGISETGVQYQLRTSITSSKKTEMPILTYLWRNIVNQKPQIVTILFQGVIKMKLKVFLKNYKTSEDR